MRKKFFIVMWLVLLPFMLLAQEDNKLSEILIGEEGPPVISEFVAEDIDLERFKQPLEVVMETESLDSYEFVGSVGGVSFASVVKFDHPPESIEISFVEANEDGKRLMLEVDGNKYYPKIYDWQLKPIAEYANSVFNACVSLFGPETTDNYYNIVYHPAFQNNLLGLRLLQADIMFINLGTFWNVFSDGKELILGKGEVAPGSNGWQEYANEINKLFSQAEYQSWVLTDYGVDIRINSYSDSLLIGGEPYYYFWEGDFETYKNEHSRLVNEAEALAALNDIEAYNAIVQKANNLRPEVSRVDALTEKLKAKPELIKGYNLLVFEAINRTMKFSALFRYIKINHPGKWEQFIEQIRNSPPVREIKTPQIWGRNSKS